MKDTGKQGYLIRLAKISRMHVERPMMLREVQKRYELNIQRLQSDVHRANTAMEKMRTEAVGLRMKIEE